MRQYKLYPLLSFIIVACASTCCAQSCSDRVQSAGVIDSTVLLFEFDLEETDRNYISSIHHSAISPNGSLLAIGDAQQGNVHIFELPTGILREIISEHPEYFDSVGRKAPVYPFHDGTASIMVRKKDLFDEYGRAPFSEKTLNSSFNYPVFVNDSILIIKGVTIGVFTTFGTGGGPHYGAIPYGTVFRYNLRSRNMTVHPYDLSRGTPYPRHSGIVLDNQAITFATPVIATSHARRGQWDSVFGIGFFDSSWNRVRTAMKLPDEYQTKALGYNFFTLSMDRIPSMNLNVLVSVSLLNRIYRSDLDTWISLDGIPYNKALFDRMKESGRQGFSESLVDASLGDVKVVDTGSFVIVCRIRKGESHDWSVREFDFNGNLISPNWLPSQEEADAIQSIHLLDRRHILVASLTNEKWRIRLYRREIRL